MNLRVFLDGFGSIYGAIYYRFDLEDNIDRCAFFYYLSIGWYDMYHPENGDERDPWNYLVGTTPLKVPKEDYDAIMKALNEPLKYIEGLANLMKRKLP